MFDLLLSRGISPLETDHRGYVSPLLDIVFDGYAVIPRFLCVKGDGNGAKLLQHAFKQLLKEVVERLLRQQTKDLRVTACRIT